MYKWNLNTQAYVFHTLKSRPHFCSRELSEQFGHFPQTSQTENVTKTPTEISERRLNKTSPHPSWPRTLQKKEIEAVHKWPNMWRGLGFCDISTKVLVSKRKTKSKTKKLHFIYGLPFIDPAAGKKLHLYCPVNAILLQKQQRFQR